MKAEGGDETASEGLGGEKEGLGREEDEGGGETRGGQKEPGDMSKNGEGEPGWGGGDIGKGEEGREGEDGCKDQKDLGGKGTGEKEMGEGEGGMGEGEGEGEMGEGEGGGRKRDEKLEAERELGGGEQSRARAHCKPGSQIRHPPPINSSPRASRPSRLPGRVAPPQNAPGRPEGWEPDSAWHARPVTETLRCGIDKKGRLGASIFYKFLRWNVIILRSDFEEEEKGGGGERGGRSRGVDALEKKNVRLDKRYYIT